jgi:hypothetical protein
VIAGHRATIPKQNPAQKQRDIEERFSYSLARLFSALAIRNDPASRLLAVDGGWKESIARGGGRR